MSIIIGVREEESAIAALPDIRSPKIDNILTLPHLEPSHLAGLEADACLHAFGDTVSDKSYKFANSFVSSRACDVALNTTSLILDIGGTKTAVLVRVVGDTPKDIHYEPLFEVLNEDLKPSKFRFKPMTHFFGELTKEISDHLHRTSHCPRDIKGVSIIWSNALKFYELAVSGVSGIGGSITGVEDKSSYIKKEWFTKGIQDGFNLTEVVRSQLGNFGFFPKALVLMNDTIAVAKAIPGAHVGGVASTGTNLCMLMELFGHYFNTEAGGSFIIPRHNGVLSSYDEVLNAQDVTSGTGMPILLKHYLQVSARTHAGLRSLVDTDAFKREKFDGKDMTLLAAGEYDAFLARRSRRGVHGLYTPDNFALAAKVSDSIAVLGGQVLAALVRSSLVHVQAEQKSLIAAIDSRQARELESYAGSFKRTLDGMARRNGLTLDLNICKPDNGATVPQQGAGNALDEFMVA